MKGLSWTFSLLSFFQPLQVSESKQEPPTELHFSILDVTIGKDDFGTLQNKLGPAKRCQTKRHDGVDIAGYASLNEDVLFEFGEAGGGDVTGFSLSLPTRTTRCRLSPLYSQASGLTTKGGVHLGMTEQEFIKMFGAPATRNRLGQWKYDWTLEAKYTEEEKKAAVNAGHPLADSYLIGITIEAEFKKGRLSYFYISRLETT